MSSISPDDIRWNDEARAKILEDSDRVLREAVLGVASTHADGSWEDAFAELNARLKDQFIDFEPGPDLRKYAEVIVAGEIEGAGGTSDDADSGDAGDSAGTGYTGTESTGTESTGTETTDAAAAGEERASDIAADAGASEPATPETDGSADEASANTVSAGDGTEDPASGDTSDGQEAPNETIDDPSDPTVTDEPSA